MPISRDGPLKAKERDGQLQTVNLIMVVTCNNYVIVFTLCCEIDGIHCVERLKKNCITFDDTFVLRIFHFGGRWSVTLKNRGRSKKTDGWRGPKTRGSSLAVGTDFERGSAPHGDRYCIYGPIIRLRQRLGFCYRKCYGEVNVFM